MEQFLESTFLKISPSSCKKINIYRKRINRLKTLIEETVKKLMNRCESIYFLFYFAEYLAVPGFSGLRHYAFIPSLRYGTASGPYNPSRS